MKKTLFYVFLLMAGVLLASSCGRSREGDGRNDRESHAQADTGHAKITFTEYQHDFGKMTEGEVVTYTFQFRNTGTADLLITSVSASCGCTVPKYSRKPVKPGETGEIDIEFNSQGKMGAQRKSIAVRGNTSPPVTILQIMAQVEPADEK